jgi:hypothetical protein
VIAVLSLALSLIHAINAIPSEAIPQYLLVVETFVLLAIFWLALKMGE